MPDDLALLKEQHTRLKDIWRDFHDYRANKWDPVIRRQAPQTETIPLYAQYVDGVDVQSPDLEKALTDWLIAQLLELTKVDAFSLDNHVKAKEDVEDIRIVLAGSWGQQNDKKKISRHMLASANRYGLGVAFKPWNMPEEPDLEGVEGKDAESKRDKYWDDYYADEDNCPFGFVPISPLEIMCLPVTDPEIVIQESKIKYVHAKELRRQQDLGGGKLTLDRLKKVAFVGDNEPIEEYQTTGSDTGPEVYVLKRAYLDKASGRWKWDCWVRVDGQDVGESEQLEGGDVPYDRCPYFFVASGNEQATESDPHLRFRPKIYSLLVDTVEWNALVTQLDQAIAFRLAHPFYVRLDGMDGPAIMAAADMAMVEGQGAERRLVIKLPEAGGDELMTAPRLEAMPVTDITVLIERLKMIKQDMAFHAPNRFLTGSAELAPEVPGSTFLNQAQAAQTTVHGDLENFDAFVEDWLQAECQAWVYWDEDTEVAKPRKYRVHGDEPVSKNPMEAGDEVYIDVHKLKRPFVLAVHTSNMTQQERALEDQSADLAYLNKAITKSQWLKRRGADDPEKQADDLWKDQMELMADTMDQPIYADQYRRFISAMTDTAPPPPPMEEGQQGRPGQGQMDTTRPAIGIHAGTAPALGSSQGTSNGVVPGMG
jgi:hypothetical protein